MKRIYDMVVLGGGPGGYTAALYAARAGRSVLVLERLSPGGQMALTSEIDNYPGFPEGVDGFELGMKFQEQAHRFGAETATYLAGSIQYDIQDVGHIVATHLVVGYHLLGKGQ